MLLFQSEGMNIWIMLLPEIPALQRTSYTHRTHFTDSPSYHSFHVRFTFLSWVIINTRFLLLPPCEGRLPIRQLNMMEVVWFGWFPVWHSKWSHQILTHIRPRCASSPRGVSLRQSAPWERVCPRLAAVNRPNVRLWDYVRSAYLWCDSLLLCVRYHRLNPSVSGDHRIRRTHKHNCCGLWGYGWASGCLGTLKEYTEGIRCTG